MYKLECIQKSILSTLAIAAKMECVCTYMNNSNTLKKSTLTSFYGQVMFNTLNIDALKEAFTNDKDRPINDAYNWAQMLNSHSLIENIPVHELNNLRNTQDPKEAIKILTSQKKTAVTKLNCYTMLTSATLDEFRYLYDLYRCMGDIPISVTVPKGSIAVSVSTGFEFFDYNNILCYADKTINPKQSEILVAPFDTDLHQNDLLDEELNKALSYLKTIFNPLTDKGILNPELAKKIYSVIDDEELNEYKNHLNSLQEDKSVDVLVDTIRHILSHPCLAIIFASTLTVFNKSMSNYDAQKTTAPEAHYWDTKSCLKKYNKTKYRCIYIELNYD